MFLCKLVSLCLCASLTTSCVAVDAVYAVPENAPVEVVVNPLVEILELEQHFHTPENCPLMSATCIVKSADGVYTGSGVFIEKDAVMTAAHIASVCVGGSIMTDFNHPKIKIIGMWTPNSDSVWSGCTRDGDIAILQLECEVEDVNVLDMIFELNSNYTPNQYDNVFIAGCSVGYKKQSRKGVFLYYGILQNSPDSVKIWSSKAMVWYGDSGGPVTVKINDNFYVIAVTSGFDLVQESVVNTSACNVMYYKTEIEEYLNSF